MKDAQKPDHVSLGTLIERLREGVFVIPDFQRDFEWKPWDIRHLMRSIFLDYYIGSLLLWKGRPENFSALSCEPIYGHPSPSNDPQHIVLDGQQRLTAIYYTFLAPDVPLPNRKNRYLYFLKVDSFLEENYDDAFTYDWTWRGKKVAAERDLQFSEHMFPLSVIGSSDLWDLANWVQDYEKYWITQSKNAEMVGDSASRVRAELSIEYAQRFGRHLKELVQQYQVSYIELDQNLDISKVCDIFTNVNSRGIRLNVFDLINAMIRPKGLQLRHMWNEVSPKLDFYGRDRMNIYVLQLMSIVLQRYCSPKYLYYLIPGQVKKVRDHNRSLKHEVLIGSRQEFECLWHESITALESAIRLLRHPQEFGAISSHFLPYKSIIPVFTALQSRVDALDPFQQLEAQNKIRNWYWASVFTNRYSGSVESTAARDYLEVCQWFDDDEVVPAVIEECRSRVESLDLYREARRGTSIYNGVFNLLVLQGARDWITGKAPQHDDLDDHHIVPQSWGKGQGMDGEIDTILNRTPLTAQTNRHIVRDRLPNEYLPELMVKNGEDVVRSTLESHYITRDALDVLLQHPFGRSEFDQFIAIRRDTIVGAIKSRIQ